MVSTPTAVAVNSSGQVWFMDYHVVRTVTGGKIQTVAGSHAPAAAGEGGPLATSLLRGVTGMTKDTQGNYYFSDEYTHSVYRATPDLQSITRIAGTGFPGQGSDNGPGVQTALYYPNDVEVDSAGNVYIADMWGGRVCQVTPGGYLTTLSPGTGRIWNEPNHLRFDGSGNLYITQYPGLVLKMAPGGAMQIFAGGRHPKRLFRRRRTGCPGAPAGPQRDRL